MQETSVLWGLCFMDYLFNHGLVHTLWSKLLSADTLPYKLQWVKSPNKIV